MIISAVLSSWLISTCVNSAAESLTSSKPGEAHLRSFAARGVVKQLKTDDGTILLSHEAISNYMDAMTMPFKVKEPKELNDLRPGDQVSFRLSVTDTESWIAIQTNFIGMSERILYNCQVLVLTWALNKRFMTTFRQPPNVSDIYITSFPKPISVFIVGGVEAISSKVFSNTSSEYVINAYDFSAYVNMTIFVPFSVYNALDAIDANRQIIIRSFADKYMAAGIVYTIQTY